MMGAYSESLVMELQSDEVDQMQENLDAIALRTKQIIIKRK